MTASVGVKYTAPDVFVGGGVDWARFAAEYIATYGYDAFKQTVFTRSEEFCEGFKQWKKSAR